MKPILISLILSSLIGCNTLPRDLCGTERAMALVNGTEKYNINDRRFKWTHFDLKWYIVKDDLKAPWLRERIQRSGDWWSRFTPFTFEETSDLEQANLLIWVEDYGDTGWYGLAGYPPIASRGDNDTIIRLNIHYLPMRRPRGLENTDSHEIGHALGLDHTEKCFDVMSPGIGTTIRGSYDSRKGINDLYELKRVDKK